MTSAKEETNVITLANQLKRGETLKTKSKGCNKNWRRDMEEELKKIREHIERTVIHIAREHGVMDEVVWKQMFVASAEKFKTKKINFI